MDYLFSLQDPFRCGIIILCALLVVLWMSSMTFRYYVKVAALSACVLATSYPFAFVCILKPRDPSAYRIGGWLLVMTTRFLNIKWEFRGEEKLMKMDGPCVIVCNHQSIIDLIGMMRMWPDRCVPMVKKEWCWYGACGVVAYVSGSIIVDRFNRTNAIEACNKALAYMKRNRIKLWVFPEGTRCSGQELLPFKKGAFYMAIRGQIPIVPIVFSSYKPFYSTEERKFIGGGHVIVEVLDAIQTEGMNEDNVQELSTTARALMIEMYEKINAELEQRERNDPS